MENSLIFLCTISKDVCSTNIIKKTLLAACQKFCHLLNTRIRLPNSFLIKKYHWRHILRSYYLTNPKYWYLTSLSTQPRTLTKYTNLLQKYTNSWHFERIPCRIHKGWFIWMWMWMWITVTLTMQGHYFTIMDVMKFALLLHSREAWTNLMSAILAFLLVGLKYENYPHTQMARSTYQISAELPKGRNIYKIKAHSNKENMLINALCSAENPIVQIKLFITELGRLTTNDLSWKRLSNIGQMDAQLFKRT